MITQENININIAKILIVGESQVGKTSILFRYSENHYQDAMVTTLGKLIKIK